MCEICSELTMKATERSQLRRSSVFVNFEHISHLFLVSLFFTLSRLMFTEQVHLIATGVIYLYNHLTCYAYHYYYPCRLYYAGSNAYNTSL